MPSPEITDPTLLAKAEITDLYEVLPEQEPSTEYTVRTHLLSAFALLNSGQELRISEGPMYAINSEGNKRLTLSAGQRIDRIELAAGYPLRRHEWAREFQGESAKRGYWQPFLARMHELQSQNERDFELEQATIEIGSLLVMGADENGNRMITYSQVRANEVYKLPHDKSSLSGKNNPPQKQETVVGFPLDIGFFAYGEWLGFHSKNAARWYVTTNGYAAPLDTITNIGSAWTEDKKLIGIEYKQLPLAVA